MNFLSDVHKSRKIILEMLELRGFDIDKYNNFTINEVDLMIKNSTKKMSPDKNTLDIILNHKSNNSVVCVKYIIFNKPRPQNLKLIIDDMVEDYKENDTIIFITKDKLNDSNFNNLFNSYKNIFIQIFDINSLKINISKHVLVPKLRILSDVEKEEIKTKYGIDDLSKMNIIKETDAQAKFYGVRKKDVVEISRVSETAGIYKVWRYCE